MDFIFLVMALAGLCAFCVSKNTAARGGGLLAAIIFGPLWFFTSCAIIVPPGHAGVVFNRLAGVERIVLTTGCHFIVPLVQTVAMHDCRTQSMSFQGEEAVSSDQQVVHTDLTVNFHPHIPDLPLLYQEVGYDYPEKIVTPVVREALKAEVAKHPVDQLLANREQVSGQIRDYVSHKLGERHIDMELITLTNVKFSHEYQSAVELKQVALQQAEAKRNDLLKAKVEAEITRTVADAEAYKITQTNKALAGSPEYVRLEAIRKLNPNAQVVYVPHGSSILIPGPMQGDKGNTK